MQQLGCQRACGKEGVRGASAKNDGGRAWAMRGLHRRARHLVRLSPGLRASYSTAVILEGPHS